MVAFAAPQRATVDTQRLVPSCPAGSLLPQPVHRTEGGCGQGRERARTIRHRLRDALAAGQPADQEMPRIALVVVAAGRADRRASVPAADVGVAVELAGRGVLLDRLPGAGVDQGSGALQPHRTDTAAATLGRGLDPGLAHQRPKRLLKAPVRPTNTAHHASPPTRTDPSRPVQRSTQGRQHHVTRTYWDVSEKSLTSRNVLLRPSTSRNVPGDLTRSPNDDTSSKAVSPLIAVPSSRPVLLRSVWWPRHTLWGVVAPVPSTGQVRMLVAPDLATTWSDVSRRAMISECFQSD